MKAKLWTLVKDAHQASAIVRTVAGMGFELRYEWNGELRQSQTYRDHVELSAAANHKRQELLGRG